MKRIHLLLTAIVALAAIALVVERQPAEAVWRQFGGGNSAWFYQITRACRDGAFLEIASNQGALSRPVDLKQFNGLNAAVFSESLVSSAIEAKPLEEPLLVSYYELGGGSGQEIVNFYGSATFIFEERLDISTLPKLVLNQFGGLLNFIDIIDIEDRDCFVGVPPIADGRVNGFDSWATAAIYCEDDMVKVYAITADSTGQIAFAVPNSEIIAKGKPTSNTLLDSAPSPLGGTISLYLLTSGELQLVGPSLPPETAKGYSFTFAGCVGVT
ncbi:MAG: hypothetical protein JNJ61_09795 [Anaerolineae bacterium]|nr:hypothetical protein [Anaerolineae bacterium]